MIATLIKIGRSYLQFKVIISQIHSVIPIYILPKASGVIPYIIP